MRYFFLAYALVAILVVGVFGLRGDKFSEPPIRIFPDMDEQDKIKAQSRDDFFADGLGSRRPVEGTQPQSIGGTDAEFGAATGYLSTGAVDEFYANGLPAELEITPEILPAFLAHGQEHFQIFCTPCHGESGDGNGITSKLGVPGVANLHDPRFAQETYPDGRLYHVITHGQGLMSGYGYNLTLRDRWSIVAYVRALQLAREAPLSDPQIKTIWDAAVADSAQ